MISVELKTNLDISQALKSTGDLVRQVIDDGLTDLQRELVEQSPVGATGELRQGWRLIPTKPDTKNPLEFRAVILNDADDALGRVVGQPPGTKVSAQQLTPWVYKVLRVRNPSVVARYVARKIEDQGTDRWQSGVNFAGLNRKGDVAKGGLIDRKTQVILSNLKKVK